MSQAVRQNSGSEFEYPPGTKPNDLLMIRDMEGLERFGTQGEHWIDVTEVESEIAWQELLSTDLADVDPLDMAVPLPKNFQHHIVEKF